MPRAPVSNACADPAGQVAAGKLAGAIAYGAQVISIQGSFDDGLRLVREISMNSQIMLVNSINPYRLQGQKSAAFEICDELGNAPIGCACPSATRATSLPIGWASRNITRSAKHRICRDCWAYKPREPRRWCSVTRSKKPETIATAIRIGRPARGEEALIAAQDSKGRILSVTDDEILAAWKMLAEIEGIWVEPASAAGVAGLRQSRHTKSARVRQQDHRVRAHRPRPERSDDVMERAPFRWRFQQN